MGLRCVVCYQMECAAHQHGHHVLRPESRMVSCMLRLQHLNNFIMSLSLAELSSASSAVVLYEYKKICLGSAALKGVTELMQKLTVIQVCKGIWRHVDTLLNPGGIGSETRGCNSNILDENKHFDALNLNKGVISLCFKGRHLW